MANKKLTQVKINSIDVSSYLLKWKIEENFGNPIYEAEIDLVKTVTSVVTLATGQTVEIWEGYVTTTDTKIFSGELDVYSPEPGKIKVKAKNKIYAMVRNIISAKIYDKSVGGDPIAPDGKISLCFTDLVNTYAGLTATHGTTVQDSGTAVTLTKFVCDQTNPKERADRLAEALGWIYFYKASDDKVYFQPKQFATNSMVMTVGSNVSNVPKWEYDKTDLINDLRVDGAFQDQLLTEVFSGDGSTTVFTLSATPVGDVVLYYGAATNFASTAPLQNQKKTLGVTDSTTSFDYTVDKSTKKITTSGFTAASATNNILVEYVGTIAVPVHLRDDTSVATYGIHARTIQLTDVLTVGDCETRARNVLDKFKTPFQSAILQVPHNSSNSFSIGDKINVVDTKNSPNVDAFFTIFSISRNYPDGFEEIGIGDRVFDTPELFINMGERIHRLERELISTSVLTEIRDVTFNVGLGPYSFDVNVDYINDSFVVDHSDNGVLYGSTESQIIDDFETVADWAEDTGSITLTETADSTAGHFWIGTQGINYSWVATSSTGLIVNTTSQGDLSGITGVSSGTPSRGTFGLWVYTPSASSITQIKLRIGSSSSDYKEYIAKQYAFKVAGTEVAFALVNNGRTLLLFDADAPDATAGTVDWTAIDYLQIRFTVSAAGNLTFDYLTGSKNNVISSCGLGDRTTDYVGISTTYTY